MLLLDYLSERPNLPLLQVTDALAQAGLESSNLIVGIDFTKSNEWTGLFVCFCLFVSLPRFLLMLMIFFLYQANSRSMDAVYITLATHQIRMNKPSRLLGEHYRNSMKII
jgi:hypothetical protein